MPKKNNNKKKQIQKKRLSKKDKKIIKLFKTRKKIKKPNSWLGWTITHIFILAIHAAKSSSIQPRHWLDNYSAAIHAP